MTAATRTPGESPKVTLRIKPGGIAYADGKAKEHGNGERSWALAAMLRYAARHMTEKDWKAAARDHPPRKSPGRGSLDRTEGGTDR